MEFLTTVVLEREDEDQEEIDIDVDVMKKPQVKLLTLHARSYRTQSKTYFASSWTASGVLCHHFL